MLNIDEAIDCYYQAFEVLQEADAIQVYQGMETTAWLKILEYFGKSGKILLLDRITLSLIKNDRIHEAIYIAECYFDRYRRDQSLKGAEAIQKRINKFQNKL